LRMGRAPPSGLAPAPREPEPGRLPGREPDPGRLPPKLPGRAPPLPVVLPALDARPEPDDFLAELRPDFVGAAAAALLPEPAVGGAKAFWNG